MIVRSLLITCIIHNKKIYLKLLAKSLSLSLIVLGAGFYLYKTITLFGEFEGGAVGLGLVHVAPSEMLLTLIHL